MQEESKKRIAVDILIAVLMMMCIFGLYMCQKITPKTPLADYPTVKQPKLQRVLNVPNLKVKLNTLREVNELINQFDYKTDQEVYSVED